MRIALVGPDLEENLSIRYLAGALNAAGHSPTIVPFDGPQDLPRARSAAAEAELVALSMCYQIRAPEFLELARALKAGAAPAARSWRVATTPPAWPRSCSSSTAELDVVAIHEGEQTLVELASLPRMTPEALRRRQRHRLSRARGDRRPPSRAAIVADLDTLPWPDRSGPARLVVGVPSAYMMGSRGCVSACDYCAITTLHRLAPGKRFRQRDPGADRRGDGLAVPRARRAAVRVPRRQLPRALGVEEHGAHRGAGPRAPQPRRAAHRSGAQVPPRRRRSHEVFRQLREMGLLRVFLGIESGTPEGLASIGRRQTVDEAHRALEICEGLGISTQYTLIIFHPEATRGRRCWRTWASCGSTSRTRSASAAPRPTRARPWSGG